MHKYADDHTIGLGGCAVRVVDADRVTPVSDLTPPAEAPRSGHDGTA
ncbi:hypothetical protein ACWENR_10265 [Micromonospora sp. NPDC004336]